MVLDIVGSMRSTRVSKTSHVRPHNLMVLIRTRCGYIVDGLRYPPNRPVTVLPGSFVVLSQDRFAVVRLDHRYWCRDGLIRGVLLVELSLILIVAYRVPRLLSEKAISRALLRFR